MKLSPAGFSSSPDSGNHQPVSSSTFPGSAFPGPASSGPSWNQMVSSAGTYPGQSRPVTDESGYVGHVGQGWNYDGGGGRSGESRNGGDRRKLFAGLTPAEQPQPAPMVIPCSMIGIWHYQEQTWEADLGVTWFDALARTIEIVYRPAGQAGTFQYTGNHFSPRDRWMRCFQEIPYTDLPLDMVALAEQFLPWFPPFSPDGQSSSTRHEVWQQGQILGLRWEIRFIARDRRFPLGRHGWQLNFVREGLTKSWNST